VNLLIRLLLNAAALWLIAYFHIIPGVGVTSLTGALIAALVLGVVNAVIRPILILLSLPLEILTLGLFTFVINALLFWFVGSLGVGLVVSGFGAALLGSIVLSIISFILAHVFAPARA
jgi:putative membrane protein